MDRVSRNVRSQVMSSVKSTGTRLEERLASDLARARIGRFERNPSDLVGHPDFVFRTRKVAVFLDSCFWHDCRWHCRMPATNRQYWNAKIQRNRARDKQVTQQLRRERWIVIRIWEHSIANDGGMRQVLEKIKQGVKKK